MDNSNLYVGLPSKKGIPCEKCRYGKITNPFNTFCAFYEVKPTAIYCNGEDCQFFESFAKYAGNKENEE